MKRILIALALLIGSVASAAAACVSPAVMHDFPGTAFNMSLGTNPIDTNCAQNTMVQGVGASGAALAGNPVRAGLSDGTNTQNWLAALALADGVNGNNTGAMAQWYWNGATYDRATGTAALGAYVQAKSGSFASGSFAAGSIANGADVVLGNNTDAASCASGTSLIACVRQSDFDIKAGAAATGAAVPASAIYLGANVGGNLTGSIKCNSSAIYDASTSGSTQLVALSGATTIYVCGYSIMAGGTVNVKLITGTGAACVTGAASITPAYQLTAQAGIVDGSAEFRGLKGAASSELCINTNGAVAVQAIVYYTQF